MDSDIVKKIVYEKLFTKANTIDTKIPSTGRLVTKTRFNSDKQGIESKIVDIDQKIPNISGVVKNTYFNTKVTRMENKIPGVAELVRTASLDT